MIFSRPSLIPIGFIKSTCTKNLVISINMSLWPCRNRHNQNNRNHHRYFSLFKISPHLIASGRVLCDGSGRWHVIPPTLTAITIGNKLEPFNSSRKVSISSNLFTNTTRFSLPTVSLVSLYTFSEHGTFEIRVSLPKTSRTIVRTVMVLWVERVRLKGKRKCGKWWAKWNKDGEILWQKMIEHIERKINDRFCN